MLACDSLYFLTGDTLTQLLGLLLPCPSPPASLTSARHFVTTMRKVTIRFNKQESIEVEVGRLRQSQQNQTGVRKV